MDMSAEDFFATLAPAPIQDAVKYFRRSNKMAVIRGVSFKDGFVPENPVACPSVPISVIDPTYDDFEEIEVVRFNQDAHYFLQSIEGQKAYVLMELKAEMEAKKPRAIGEFKGITPEMRVIYTLHLIERKRREEKEPAVAVKLMMEEVGATVEKVKATNRGFEVVWKFDKYRFVTLFDKKLQVVNAGYCVRNQDKILSPRSIVNVLKDGIAQHGNDGMIHATVAYDGERFGADDDDDDPDDE